MNMAGMMAKYLETSLATLKVVRLPRVMSSCLPISTTEMSLAGSESRSTMLPASLAAWVPEFMARPTSARARAGASLVPSPVMATSLPSACSARMRSILSSGLASATKSSTPASAAMVLAVRGLSPVIITVRMPMARRRSKRSLMPGLTTSFSSTRPMTLPRAANRERGGTLRGDHVHRLFVARRQLVAQGHDVSGHGVAGSLAVALAGPGPCRSCASRR